MRDLRTGTMGGGESRTEGLVETVKEKAKDLASGASEMVDEAKEKVEEWASDAARVATQAKDKAQEYASTAAHKAEELGENVTGLIRRYPMLTLLVGFGIGFLAATVLTRASDKD